MEAHKLHLGNHPGLNPENEWTFEHALGHRRQIDFLIYSRYFQVRSIYATSLLHLGSDHRAVCGEFILPQKIIMRYTTPRPIRGRKPGKDFNQAIQKDLCLYRQGDDYGIRGIPGKDEDLHGLPHNLVDDDLPHKRVDGSPDDEGEYDDDSINRSGKRVADLPELIDLILRRIGEEQFHPEEEEKPYKTPTVQDLLRRRKNCTGRERKDLSKSIQKEVRRQHRRILSERTTTILNDFKDLRRLNILHRFPIKQEKGEECSPDAFAELLSRIFDSNEITEYPRRDLIAELPPFTMEELRTALKKMSNGKCADETGITLEMIKYGPDELHYCVISLFNQMLQGGKTEDLWRRTLFRMLPKSGDLSEATNWRPIAILNIFYKIFSKIFYNRIRERLDKHQTPDQCGFRSGIRIEDALGIFETIASGNAEYGIPLCIASLDLKKAFDTIEHHALFDALREQDLLPSEIALLLDLYTDQRGSANGSAEFDILRGVKQGDTLSSLLFNAGLEHAFKKWKSRLKDHGILFAYDKERLTNIRYADDILLFGKNIDEISDMLEILCEELRAIGLEMHPSKTKVLTSSCPCPFQFLDVDGMMINVLSSMESHKYLGRLITLNPAMRVTVELKNRINAGWHKFHEHRQWLCNHHVHIGLRLRLFDAVVTPSILFGGAVLPLSENDLKRLNIVQRRMLRSMIGWRRFTDEPWEETMRRMKRRMADALQHFPLSSWSERFHRNRWRYAIHVVNNEKNRLPFWLAQWVPLLDPISIYMPYRGPGRPRLRWDDHLHGFCYVHLGLHHWLDIERYSKEELLLHEEMFLKYCMKHDDPL